MNNHTDLIATPSSGEVILSRTDNNFIQNVIEQVIPANVWDTIEASAPANGFMAVDRGIEQQYISTEIMKKVRIFWDNAQDLERQGYTVSDFRLQIKFKSLIAKSYISIDILTNETERKINIGSADIIDNPAKIQMSTTEFRPEDIPYIIEDVRTGNTPADLPRIVVSTLKEEFEKNPNWTGSDLETMSASEAVLDLFQLTIQSTLHFESTHHGQISAASSSSPALLDNPDTQLSSLETTSTSPAFLKVASNQVEVKRGLFRNSIYMKYKPKPAEDLTDVQQSLHSLSMGDSASDSTM